MKTSKKGVRLGLVIQGPLTSVGLSGKSWRSAVRGEAQKVVEHDCVESILETVRNCPKEVVTVVSTWSSESASKIRILTEAMGDQVVISDQPSQLEEHGKPTTNDYRQFWSTLQGVNKILKNVILS